MRISARVSCILLLLIAAAFVSEAKPMKARVIQPLFAPDAKGMDESFKWTIDQLNLCDESLDIVVLPEFSEVPGATPTGDDFMAAVRKYGPVLLETCRKTAARCSTMVFVGAIEIVEQGPRNTTFVFDRKGNIAGRYLKQHLTRGEWANYGFDKSYTTEWSKPYLLEMEGLKFAFLTCYDFYFYESFSNIGRWQPDIIIGCSHQRSDPLEVLDIINAFCSYNTGAYLVRSSVSMGENSEFGGCSCVVAPTGKILGNLKSRVASLDVTFDPEQKYRKPAGYGNPPALHSEYIEIGRNPWKYRPGGSAIVPPVSDAPEKRLCAHNGLGKALPDNILAACGAAVAMGAPEISLDVKADSGKFTCNGVRFEDILSKLSCHVIMNLHLDGSWSTEDMSALSSLVFDYDASEYVYYSSDDLVILKAAAKTGVPICLMQKKSASDAVSEAVKAGCEYVQLKNPVSSKLIAKAREYGIRVIVSKADKPETAAALFAAGAQTVVTDDYQRVEMVKSGL